MTCCVCDENKVTYYKCGPLGKKICDVCATDNYLYYKLVAEFQSLEIKHKLLKKDIVDLVIDND